MLYCARCNLVVLALCFALPTCRYLVEQLNKYGLAYVHMVEDRYQNFELPDAPFSARSLDPFRKVGQPSSSIQCPPPLTWQTALLLERLRPGGAEASQCCGRALN
jgi:hypothetical protein